MNKTFVSFKESLLPINQISLSDDEMLLVRGGNDGGGNDAGSGAGCGCDCYSGSGCEASSKTIRSNLSASASMYWATESGLINIHGHIRDSRVGIWSNNLRIDMPRALLRIFFWSMPTSELWIAA